MLVPNDDRPPDSAELERDFTFSVVVAYEDFEAGKHAQRTCDSIVGHMGGECRFVTQMWKFEALAVPSMREMAAKDAALADLVVICCHGTDDLPIDVKAWIELWVGLHCAGCGLVALFDRASERPERARYLHEYLSMVACRGGMDYFSHPEFSPGGDAGTAFRDLGQRREAGHDSPTQVAAVPTRNANVAHWGLNE